MAFFSIAKEEFKAGETRQIRLSAARLYTDEEMTMPVTVICGKKPGPTLFVSAALHGDELNGIEIIRRLIALKTLKVERGVLILVHIVNVFGVLHQSRYLPDRRDLNRSFPGTQKGSLAGRLAYTFVEQILEKSDYGIDLHTGAIHRSNLPQIRADFSDKETRDLAKAFGVPVMLNANLRDASLREAGKLRDVRILLYEAGEALRFDEVSIRAGVRGIQNVMFHLGMTRRRRKRIIKEPYIANHSKWVRANASGFFRAVKKLGDQVNTGDTLARISNPFGKTLTSVVATRSGVIIGQQNIPLVHEGDAMFHIAFFSDADEDIVEDIEIFQEVLMPELENE